MGAIIEHAHEGGNVWLLYRRRGVDGIDVATVVRGVDRWLASRVGQPDRDSWHALLASALDRARDELLRCDGAPVGGRVSRPTPSPPPAPPLESTTTGKPYHG